MCCVGCDEAPHHLRRAGTGWGRGKVRPHRARFPLAAAELHGARWGSCLRGWADGPGHSPVLRDSDCREMRGLQSQETWLWFSPCGSGSCAFAMRSVLAPVHGARRYPPDRPVCSEGPNLGTVGPAAWGPFCQRLHCPEGAPRWFSSSLPWRVQWVQELLLVPPSSLELRLEQRDEALGTASTPRQHAARVLPDAVHRRARLSPSCVSAASCERRQSC